MEIENYTKEPKLEEYGLVPFSYENYKKEKNDLEKSFEDFKKNINSGVNSYLSSLLGLMLFVGIYISIYLFTKDNYTYLILYWSVFFILYLIEGAKSKEIEKEIEIKHKETNEKVSFLKNKIYPFEQASVKYYENYLEQFFQNNLYKKRSGSKEFEQSLFEFSSMIDEVEEINKKLVLTHNNLFPYKLYLEGRQINHEYQKNNKRVFSSFEGIKTDLNNKELIQKQEKNIEEPVLDINKKIKEDFKNKQDLEIAKKEAEKLIAPEKRYRTARKIDNWEEINKKRKETGNKGEEIVFALEQEHFSSIDRNDLAEKVRHVSVEDGDGLGYDILSFFDDGKEKYIEVKSTTVSIESPFNLSKNELEFLQDHYDDAFIYRVLVSNDIPEIKVRPSFEILESDIIPVSYIVKNK